MKMEEDGVALSFSRMYGEALVVQAVNFASLLTLCKQKRGDDLDVKFLEDANFSPSLSPRAKKKNFTPYPLCYTMYYQAGSSKAAGWYRQNHSPDMRTPDRFLCESNDREEWYLCSKEEEEGEGGERRETEMLQTVREEVTSDLFFLSSLSSSSSYFVRSLLLCFFLCFDPPSDLWDHLRQDVDRILLLSSHIWWLFPDFFSMWFLHLPFTTRLYASLFMLLFLFFFSFRYSISCRC